jgi:hypothetical protein
MRSWCSRAVTARVCHGAGVDALAALAAAGFDIVHPFDTAAASQGPGLAVLGGGPRLGLLIGNTRALWPRFCDALRDPALAAESDPLDRYTERAIGGALHGAFRDPRIYYAHHQYGGAFVPLQHLAVATGLGALAPSHLVIHPVYGPWFALRAAVVIDGEPPRRAPIAQPCRCNAACRTALEHAQRSTDWRDWLALRDCCTLRGWRYSDDQARFHYLKVWRPPRQDV